MTDKTPEQMYDREFLGKLVRDIWVEWAREQPDCKASWEAPWSELPERDKEVDRRIGERLFLAGLAAGEQKWIPVSERLPVVERAWLPNRPIQHTGYIVCRSDGVVQFSPAYTGLGFANIEGGRGVTVTLWMPLPTPP